MTDRSVYTLKTQANVKIMKDYPLKKKSRFGFSLAKEHSNITVRNRNKKAQVDCLINMKPRTGECNREQTNDKTGSKQMHMNSKDNRQKQQRFHDEMEMSDFVFARRKKKENKRYT